MKETNAVPKEKKTGNNTYLHKIIFLLGGIFCLTPLVSPPIALLLGLIFAQFIDHPYPQLNNKAINSLLKISVIGLGFGMNVTSALKAGKEGVLFTIVCIISVLVIGFLMGKFLKVEKKTSFLISVGTAICGGSAIAAVAPVIKAGEKQISIALGSVFILNSIALLVFPIIGHSLNLSQTQFGLWCAIAIHDTSSVVGAASSYGNHALEVATTVKLARALWIIPVTFFSAFVFKNNTRSVKIPYFIGLFVVAMISNSYSPFVAKYSHSLVTIAKAGLTLTLFLIGSGLSYKVLKTVGYKPLIQGIVLWIIISLSSLWVITSLSY